ncbi:MAG TPA: hypothetical protein VH518_24670 [Tepidisphaeraceae bacterium]|jgi:hypothetical protein
MRLAAFIALASALLTASARGHTPTSHPAEETAEESKLSFSLSANVYFVPHERTYVQPTIQINYDWLRLEARYNYEDLETTSAWAGVNFSFGKELTLDFTPMLGVVCGNTQGIAPGFELTVAWHKFELYSEAEYLFDTSDSSNNFIYTWTELTWSPLDWLYGGVVFQRTRAYETDLDIQHGLVVGVTFEHLGLAAYLMDPENDPFVILGASLEF